MDTEAVLALIADLYRQGATARLERDDAVRKIKELQAELAGKADARTE